MGVFANFVSQFDWIWNQPTDKPPVTPVGKFLFIRLMKRKNAPWRWVACGWHLPVAAQLGRWPSERFSCLLTWLHNFLASSPYGCHCSILGRPQKPSLSAFQHRLESHGCEGMLWTFGGRLGLLRHQASYDREAFVLSLRKQVTSKLSREMFGSVSQGTKIKPRQGLTSSQ